MGILQPGQRYARLAVISEAPKRGPHKYWLCVCTCGKYTTVNQGNLRGGHTQSCGCWKQDKALGNQHARLHGDSRSPEWISWSAMLDRCKRREKDYVQRGIKVCKRWRTYQNFLSDMGRKPSPQHTLDRWPNNNGNYEPGNCRWATPIQQQNNTRRTIRVAYNGKMHTLREVQELTGISATLLRKRIRSGKTGAQLFSLLNGRNRQALCLLS